MARPIGDVRQRRDRRRRSGDHRVHVGHDRPQQGRRCTAIATCSPSPTPTRRYVLRPGADDIFIGSPPLAFTYALGGLVLFPMRFGASTALLEQAVAAAAARGHPALPRDRSPSPRRRRIARCSTQAGEFDLTQPAQVRLGRRDAAGRDVRRVGAGDRHPADGRHRLDRDAAHVHRLPAATRRSPGSTGRVVPGYQATVVDDAGDEVPRGTVGRLAVSGPTGCRYLDDLEQPAAVRAARLEPHRRRVPAGRRRLLLVPVRAPTT